MVEARFESCSYRPFHPGTAEGGGEVQGKGDEGIMGFQGAKCQLATGSGEVWVRQKKRPGDGFEVQSEG